MAATVDQSVRRPLRVLWLIKGLGPGGAERLLVSLAGVIDSSAVTCEVAYLTASKNHLVAALAATGVQVTCLEASSQLDVRWLGRLRRMVVDHGIDIVHIHSPHAAALARPVLRCLGARRPAIVYTEHNAWGGYGRATRWANAVTYALDDARIAVSDDALDSIPRLLRRRSEVVVHGVDVAAVRAFRSSRSDARAALGVGDDTVVVGTVANLRFHKDYPTLLRAARRAVDAEPRITFVAIGQGPLRAEIAQEIAALGLADAFRLLGYVPQPFEAMAGWDIFTLSSLAEGYPVALMEALALGLPVVATNVGGIPDALRQGIEGLLVPPSQPELLADSIVALARDPARRAMMARAAAERAGRFDIRRAARSIEALYARVAR